MKRTCMEQGCYAETHLGEKCRRRTRARRRSDETRCDTRRHIWNAYIHQHDTHDYDVISSFTSPSDIQEGKKLVDLRASSCWACENATLRHQLLYVSRSVHRSKRCECDKRTRVARTKNTTTCLVWIQDVFKPLGVVPQGFGECARLAYVLGWQRQVRQVADQVPHLARLRFHAEHSPLQFAQRMVCHTTLKDLGPRRSMYSPAKTRDELHQSLRLGLEGCVGERAL